MRRLTRDEYFLAIASIVAARATCDRLWCGCVLVRDREIIATGYNGAPSGMAECNEVGHLLVEEKGKHHCMRTIHAEQNAIYQARKRLANLNGVIAYINATPCENCLSELLRCGVRRIICGSIYKNVERLEMTAKLTEAFGATIEYRPSPDISLVFGSEVTDVKKIRIDRCP